MVYLVEKMWGVWIIATFTTPSIRILCENILNLTHR